MTTTQNPKRTVIPHLVICPICGNEHEPLTGKPAPEPYFTIGVNLVTYRTCPEHRYPPIETD